MKDNLTEREEKFCLRYFETGNGTKSVLDAGYIQTDKAAAVSAMRLLKKPKIQERIDELRKKQEKRTEITTDRVLKELAHIAFLDLGQAYDKEGRLLHVTKMPEEVRRAIAATKVFDEFEGYGKEREKIGETTEIKTVDKVRALQLIGQHLKMFTEKHEHSGPDGKPIPFSDHEAAAKLAAILNAARSRKGQADADSGD